MRSPFRHAGPTGLGWLIALLAIIAVLGADTADKAVRKRSLEVAAKNGTLRA